MPELSLDFDDYESDKINNENSPLVNYTYYNKNIDREISFSEFDAIKTNYFSKPLTKPHTIHQDFFGHKTNVIIHTAVYLSLDKTRILKDIEVYYYLYDKQNERFYVENMNMYLGKIMNEITMQKTAQRLQLKCNFKVPDIYNYGKILAPTSTTQSFTDHVGLSLKRENSFDSDKISVRLFIEMEMIQNSQELTNVIYSSGKTKCLEYKNKLIELHKCLTEHNFSHGDMNTLGNILVNMETGNFALIDYGQSMVDFKQQSFNSLDSLIDCNHANPTIGGRNRKKRKTIRKKRNRSTKRKKRKGTKRKKRKGTKRKNSI